LSSGLGVRVFLGLRTFVRIFFSNFWYKAVENELITDIILVSDQFNAFL